MLSKKDAIAAGAFVNYIGKAADIEVVAAIKQNTKGFMLLLEQVPAAKRNYAYGEGKWTIQEVLQHIIDAERVFAYRALRMGRMDATPLPGFDENRWAEAANKINRDWEELVEEFSTVRRATEILFSNLGEAELRFTGMASNQPLNALAMGYVIAGHAQHHIDLIRDRYL